ncbi:hypothetical protein RRG08_025939 [Elysia crispata]|uniref:Uncharacterized protein n=1 Tax=Elysia crispata TaxID=231223 RepID=A0AAE0ZG32_9GAST|nr:hypothetical protein RRG08_025939 [Elysia crispata]
MFTPAQNIVIYPLVQPTSTASNQQIEAALASLQYDHCTAEPGPTLGVKKNNNRKTEENHVIVHFRLLKHARFNARLSEHSVSPSSTEDITRQNLLGCLNNQSLH